MICDDGIQNEVPDPEIDGDTPMVKNMDTPTMWYSHMLPLTVEWVNLS